MNHDRWLMQGWMDASIHQVHLNLAEAQTLRDTGTPLQVGPHPVLIATIETLKVGDQRSWFGDASLIGPALWCIPEAGGPAYIFTPQPIF